VGRIPGIGTVARHRGHDDAILQGKRAHLNRLEKKAGGGIGHETFL
jgi:hypothetical protein